MGTTVKEIGYIDRANGNTVLFTERDPVTGVESDIVWTNVTRMVVTLIPADGTGDITLDTDVDGSFIDYTVDGRLVFFLGDVVGLTAQIYDVRIVSIDAGGNKTQISHENATNRLQFDIQSTATIV